MKAVAALSFSVCLLQLHFAFVSSTMSLSRPSCDRAISVPVEVSDRSCSENNVRVDAKTLDELQSGYEQAYREWWSQGKKACDVDSITTAAKGLSNAIANFSTLVASDVVCNGDQKFGCGWSFGQGELWTFMDREIDLAKARALTSLSLELNKEGSAMAGGFCYTDSSQIAEGFFQAAGNASREACAFNREDAVSHYTDSFALALEPLVFDALVSGINKTCSTEGQGCTRQFGSLGVTVPGVNFRGSSCRVSSFVPWRLCSGPVADICCKENTKSSCEVPMDLCIGQGRVCSGRFMRTEIENVTVYTRRRQGCVCDTI